MSEWNQRAESLSCSEVTKEIPSMATLSLIRRGGADGPSRIQENCLDLKSDWPYFRDQLGFHECQKGSPADLIILPEYPKRKYVKYWKGPENVYVYDV